MQFVKVEDLKNGMRLARPIYNKQGVLLFERDSKLSEQAISSIRNFGLIGIYILEPAEPVPPMSEEDLEFERFQTMTVFALQDELEHITDTRKASKLPTIEATIVKKYGHMDKKVNFYQNLRSYNDFVCKHSLNVAILCTMISHVLNIRIEDQNNTVFASLLHDIGKVGIFKELGEGKGSLEELDDRLLHAQLTQADIIENAFAQGTPVRRICVQVAKAQMEIAEEKPISAKLGISAKILLVANKYDEMTAMQVNTTKTESEVLAIKELLSKPEYYDPEIVNALISSIHILFPGVSVELNTGEKALVLVANEYDILKPMVLVFRDNSIIDLSAKANSDIEIVDIMKTLDNRYVLDTEALKNAGF
ncbi:MAG: HD domain-containing protein [Lachnospiraceae bacterium]|nr:HD domain-containing protein [Lachnospiraceae bacterium]